MYVLSFREGEEEIRETNKQAVMYGCEKWTIKKAESQRIDAELMMKNCGVGEDC